MEFLKQNLDLILVPAGLFLMFTYHLYLLYRVLKHPSTTSIGYENHIWMSWVERVMGDSSYISIAISVISNNTSSSIYLGSMCLSLCGFIGIWVGTSTSSVVNPVYILGNTSSATISLKDISMLFAFLMGFGAFMQSVRYYVQANSLVSMSSKDLPVLYVQRLVLRGNNFWQVGLRLLYLAMALLFWSFGPIPMFVSCLVMVIFLYFLDSNAEPLHLFLQGTNYPVKKKKVEEVAVRV
ncbi:uncharacterized protein LOC122085983 [Macadamia integrifolia]|uniref:uncharacterized protein LOC122068406 n=1 Tax=Macadamia integrifolia TaxID=60698 RepID=UPI001C4E3F92|nr:uncharacterized protein LOC122068406 [Macadamia integrifolia]XP_042510558.1 uncharacterized protein LOC122085983 [Macadamia integrifolia]